MTEIEISRIEELADEVITIISERTFNSNMERAEMLHEIGSAIIEKDYYKKGKARELIQSVAEKVGRSESMIYLAVQFAERFETFQCAVKELAPNSKSLSIRVVQRALPAPKEECLHTETYQEIKTKCRNCRKSISSRVE